MQEIIVSKREESGTLYKLLKKYLREAPDSFLYKMLRKKNIVLNGKKAEGREKLTEGDSIRLFLSDGTIKQFGGGIKPDGKDCLAGQDYQKVNDGAIKEEKQPEILYEDGDILFLNKPAGWLVQKAECGDFSLNDWMISYLLKKGEITPEELLTFRPGICNRLDRNTSGIVAAGKTMAGLQFLSEAFREHRLHKYYTCIAVGEIAKPVLAQGYLVKDGRANRVKVFSAPPSGEGAVQYIKTAYRPLLVRNGFTYLEVELFTGKTHQIRAQLASDGHALLGDAKYMDDFCGKLRDKYRVKSQLLHAGRIVFENAGERFSYLDGREFIAGEPAEFERIKKMLGLEEKEGG